MAGRGRPPGSRDKLKNNFIVALNEDFKAHGVEAIAALRLSDPGGYIRAIASLMPKEMDVKHSVSPLEHLSDEQLEQVIAATDRVLAELGGAAAEDVAGISQSPENVSPLH